MDSSKAFLLAGVISSCQGPNLRASAGEGGLATLKQRPMDMQLAREAGLSSGLGQSGSLGWGEGGK